MPLHKSGSKDATEKNFHEVRHGKQFARTEKKSGKGKARKQMIAVVLSNKRKYGKRMKKR